MSLSKNPKKKATPNETDDTAVEAASDDTASMEAASVDNASVDTADSQWDSSTSRWRRLGLVPGLVIGAVFGIGVALAVPALAGMGDSTPTNTAASTSATPKGDGAAGGCSHHKPGDPKHTDSKHGDKAEGGPANKDKKDSNKKDALTPPKPPHKGDKNAPEALACGLTHPQSRHN